MLKNIDMGSAMRRLADRKIEEAMREGKFANLEGSGQPLDLEPMPADEQARLMWWAMRLLRRNDVVPDEIKYRKQIETAKSLARAARDEAELRARVAEANDLIRRLNTMGTNAIPSAVVPLDVEAELAHWRQGGP